MPPRRSRITLALALVLVACVALSLLLWSGARRAISFAALQRTIPRGAVFVRGEERPAALPEWADHATWTAINWWFGDLHEYNYEHRDVFRAAFRPRVECLELWLGRLAGDPGAALARFPTVKELTILPVDASEVTAEEIKRLLAGLHALRDLAVLRLNSADVTDDVMAALAGHPAIHTLNLSGCRITPRSIATFASLPSLTHLTLDLRHDWLKPENRKALLVLPKVKVEFHDDNGLLSTDPSSRLPPSPLVPSPPNK